MGWSIREADVRDNNQIVIEEKNTLDRSKPEIKMEGRDHLFQRFSDEEWTKYPFASKEDLKWFRDAKLGLFFHFGLSAMGKVDIGWSRSTRKLPDTGIGCIPDEVYDGWAESFRLEEFDAKKWIRLAKDGGMKYVVIITKHHDGYHLWDTDYSEHKITNSPFGRDYLKELVEECHKQDLKVGLYYSQRDWYHPDYDPMNAQGEKHQRYIEYMHNAVRELMTNYGRIDVLWWDALYWGGMFSADMWETLKIEEEVRKLQPHILINNRGSVPGDFDTPECMIGYYQNHRTWESCMPLGEGWAWTGGEVKSLKTVVQDIVRCACGSGNYLLSIGAMPTGKIAPNEAERIREIGEWMRQYGESIYETEGGPYLPTADYGSTHNHKNLYLHILNGDKKEWSFPKLGQNIRKVLSLTGEKIEYEISEEEIRLNISDHNGIDTVIKMELEENEII